MNTNTTPTTVSESSLQELIDFFLVLCWFLEKHSDEVMEEKGYKMRIFLRPFYHPIGFEQRPGTVKSQPCRTPVMIYLLNFLAGHIKVQRGLDPAMIREIFFSCFGSELSQLFQKQPLGKSDPLLEMFLQQITDKKPVFFVERFTSTRRKEPYWSANALQATRIMERLTPQRDKILMVARALCYGHHALLKTNISLGLGLKLIPLSN